MNKIPPPIATSPASVTIEELADYKQKRVFVSGFDVEIQETLWRGLCECGLPESAVGLLHGVLSVIHNAYDRPAEEHVRMLEGLLGPRNGGLFWWYLYFLGEMELTEHGSGAIFSWLTEKGESALGFLDRYGDDPDHWPQSEP